MFSYGTLPADTPTPLAMHDSENRRIAEFVFPPSKRRECKSTLRKAYTNSSLIALTGSPNVSLSDFPMPPTTIPSNRRRRTRQRVPPIFAPVKPLHIVKRSPKIVPQTSPETSLTASVVPLSDDEDDVCLSSILSELKELDNETTNNQRNSGNRHSNPNIFPATRGGCASMGPAKPEPPFQISTYEDSEMADIISTPVAGTTAPPPCSPLGNNSGFTASWEANKENIDPNGIIISPRPFSGTDGATSPLAPATSDNMLFHGPIRTHSSCPLIPDLVSTPISSPSSLTRLSSVKSTKPRRKARRVALPLDSVCHKNSSSPTTKARHRGNVVLENYIYPPESSSSSSPSLSSLASSHSYPDFSMQSDMSRRSPSLFGDMTLVGADTSCVSKLITCSPSVLSCASMSNESTGDQWYDVLSLTAYMED